MQAPLPPAEPLDEPPGVRPGSNGLVVGPGNAPPISVVTVLPRITAPASRNARTIAETGRVSSPAKAAQPCPVDMSFVSIRSLMPIGIPSMDEIERPRRYRSVEASAAARAPDGVR